MLSLVLVQDKCVIYEFRVVRMIHSYSFIVLHTQLLNKIIESR